MSDLREEFERWVTSPPYERSVARLGESSSYHGHYVDYEVQLAFEAWTATTCKEPRMTSNPTINDLDRTSDDLLSRIAELTDGKVVEADNGWRPLLMACLREIRRLRSELKPWMTIDWQEKIDMAECVHEYERITRQAEPAIGTTAEFECLDKWLESVCRSIEKGNGMTLSHSACRSLAHTLIDSRVRALELKEIRLRSLCRTS